MSTAASDRSLRDASPVLLLFVCLTIAAIIGQTWWAIAQDRKLTLASQKDNSLIAVRLLEEHARQTLQDAERKLDSVANAVRSSDTFSRDENSIGPEIMKVIAKGIHDNRYLTAMQFTNVAGESWVSSLDYPAFQFDSLDRTYIQHLLKYPHRTQSIIGHPMQRFYDQQLVLPLARNLFDKNNRHLGVISTDISVSYFSNVYARVAQKGEAIVSLFADEGFVIVRSPFEMRFLDMDISKSPVLHHLLKQGEEGFFEDKGFLDDKKTNAKLYTYRKIAGYPATTIFARDFESVLEAWHRRTIDRILFSSVTIGFIAVLTYFLLVHIRRLHRSESVLRSSEAKFVNLFQRSPVPLALLSLQGDLFLEVNDALLVQSGYQRSDVIGHSTQLLHSWQDEHEHRRYMELLLKKQTIDRLEAHLRHKDGTVRICQISARMLNSAGEQLVLFSPIDITRQREIENQIRELNIELEERVSQRTMNLIKANQELEEALLSLQTIQSELLRSEKMAALGSLVAGVAHELNTPIGNSVMVASTMQEGTVAMLDEVRNNIARRSTLDKHLESCVNGAEILKRNLQRAAELVSSFKQVAVDQSSNQRRDFDLSQALEDVVITLEPLYKKTPFSLHVSLQPDITLTSYPGPLGQIITNFITNAIAHAFDGRTQGNMWLSTRLFDEQTAEICFRDDGCGIPEQFIERVFDPFFTTKLGQGGSGLGMHIVYNLVTGVLGGKIKLQSTASQGTLITMLIPLIAPESGEPNLA